jgi:hypothetical protein
VVETCDLLPVHPFGSQREFYDADFNYELSSRDLCGEATSVLLTAQ